MQLATLHVLIAIDVIPVHFKCKPEYIWGKILIESTEKFPDLYLFKYNSLFTQQFLVWISLIWRNHFP